MSEHDHPHRPEDALDADCFGEPEADEPGYARKPDLADEPDYLWEFDEPDAPDTARRLPASMIDLEKIPRDLWEQTLAPLLRSERFLPIRKIRDERLRAEASTLAMKLQFAEADRGNARFEARQRALRTGKALPAPDADHPVSRSKVQLNIRLRADDHARLAEAAAAVGLPPTTLARALVLNGAAQVLRERGTT